jgi:hypothetical protein
MSNPVMTNQLKVVSKGYTVTCESCENDGDYYNTKSVIVQSKKTAEALYQMCKILFQYETKRGQGIGNSSDVDDSIKEKIRNFMKQYTYLLNDVELMELAECEEDEEEELDFYESICNHWKHELLGDSEYYYCRVAETTTVTYSPEDIFVEQIF